MSNSQDASRPVDKYRFEALMAEKKFCEERYSAYSDSNQKTIGLFVTLVTALAAFFVSGGSHNNGNTPYIFFIASGLLSLALFQTAAFNALGFMYSQRRAFFVGEEMKKLLGIDENLFDAATQFSLSKFFGTYNFAMLCHFSAEITGAWTLWLMGLYADSSHHTVRDMNQFRAAWIAHPALLYREHRLGRKVSLGVEPLHGWTG